MEKEEFITKIINSVDGIVKATPEDIIFEKIEQRILDSEISKGKFWLIAASIVLIISLNILFLTEKIDSNDSNLASFEFSIHKDNQLYKLP